MLARLSRAGAAILCAVLALISGPARAADAHAGPGAAAARILFIAPIAPRDHPPSMLRLVQNAPGGGGYLPPGYRRGEEPPRPLAPPRDQPRGDAYSPPPPADERPRGDAYSPPPAYDDESYSSDEVLDAGHRFFGAVSKNLAKVVEHAFKREGRPNGYILGEEASGAFVAGLRYGEGTLYTKHLGAHKVYWQGPSVGYDAGAEGSKTLILVYNLDYVEQVYNRYAGVDGSAYLVGGVGVTFQKHGDVVMAPIRSGVGVRLGANVGYLKYTRYPTWNPF